MKQTKSRGAIPIVIVQTSAFGLMACEESLSKAGFVERRDYFLRGEPDFITENDIVPGERQLLVVGTIHSDKDLADEFVRRMKAKNPNLKAAFFSVYADQVATREPYDAIIPKKPGKPFDRLIAVMRWFLEEKI